MDAAASTASTAMTTALRSGFDPAGIDVIAFDVFGTVVDWHGGIAAEASRDATATGAEHAAGARAALATPESKAAAWRRAVVEDTPAPSAASDELSRRRRARAVS